MTTFGCGHEKTPENTRTRPNGYTICRTCDLARSRRWKERNRESNRAKDRARTRSPEYRGVCSSPICTHLRGACGERRAASGARGYCRDCHLAIADVRRTLAEGMWADGWSLKDWAAALGVGISYLGPARTRGWDLPFRKAYKTQRAPAGGRPRL
jgi:hypothetical protein